MSSHYDIEMSTDDTLELDTIIKESSSAVSPISGVKHIGDDSNHKSGLKGIQTSTAVFDPPKSGEYEIYINGQTLSINVTDPSSIPSSAVAYFDPTTFSNSDTTWNDQITSNGAQDMSLNGNPQESTISSGDSSVYFDGDRGSIPWPSSIEGGSLSSFAFEFQVQHTITSSRTRWFDVENDGLTQRIISRWNSDENYNADDGNVNFRIRDVDGNRLVIAPSNTPNPKLNDGNVHSISISIDDAPNNSASMFIDGSEVSVSFGETDSPDNFETWDYDFPINYRNRAGTINTIQTMNFGNIFLHGSSISQQYL